MEQVFITNLAIEKVRHLKDIFIPLSEERMKHLIITGKNGSGKTSVVEALAGYLNNVFTNKYFALEEECLRNIIEQRDAAIQIKKDKTEILKKLNRNFFLKKHRNENI